MFSLQKYLIILGSYNSLWNAMSYQNSEEGSCHSIRVDPFWVIEVQILIDMSLTSCKVESKLVISNRKEWLVLQNLEVIVSNIMGEQWCGFQIYIKKLFRKLSSSFINSYPIQAPFNLSLLKNWLIYSRFMSPKSSMQLNMDQR
jgi:hypothetical protein